MFRRLLIANRGEVAARVLRTCKALGIAGVAVATDPDRDQAWLRDADAVVSLGGPRAYLDPDALLAAAAAERCSALHPGWGFLSENATFAARCEAARITFVGPRPLSIRQMGDKAEARRTMSHLGVAPIPGSEGPLPDADAAQAVAERLGYPVLLKALAGGGGRGMRRVAHPDELAAAFAEAGAEAEGAFGNGALYLEKLIERGRHVEFQVMGDGEGLVRVLGARDCSVQRRHQKLLEETPPPRLSGELLDRVAARLGEALGQLRYRGAGTVEMLLDTTDGSLYFMEMNTRLQVEHTVTEEVTGLDLVAVQLRIAAGHNLEAALTASGTGLRGGHAIQSRINAEDPTQGLRPVPGLLRQLVLPQGPGVRVDTHLREGDRISPHYDSMIAKVIAWGEDRAQAIARLDRALSEMVVDGVPTTIPVHRRVLADPDFRDGHVDTTFLARFPDLSAPSPGAGSRP